MPVITLEAGQLSKVQKEQLATELTASAARITGITEAGFYIFFWPNHAARLVYELAAPAYDRLSQQRMDPVGGKNRGRTGGQL